MLTWESFSSNLFLSLAVRLQSWNITVSFSRRVAASNYGCNLAWDGALGAWYYVDNTVVTYIRAASCFSVPVADALAIDAAACAPLTGKHLLEVCQDTPSDFFETLLSLNANIQKIFVLIPAISWDIICVFVRYPRFSGVGGYGPPTAPYNRTWPCDNVKASKITYLATGGNTMSMVKSEVRHFIISFHTQNNEIPHATFVNRSRT